jgi:hypothetical protein
MVERPVPAVGGMDLSVPSALQLPDGGWLLAGVPCPPDPDLGEPHCDEPSPVPLVRRLDPDDRTWSDVGTVPGDLAGGRPELVGLEGDLAIMRRTVRSGRPELSDWSYWTVNLHEGTYRELWRPRAKSASPGFQRTDCVFDGHLAFVEHREDSSSYPMSVVDIRTAEARTRPIDVVTRSVHQVICDDEGATVVGADRENRRPVARRVRDDGRLGPAIFGREPGETVATRSNRRTYVYVAQVGPDPSATTVRDDESTTSLGPPDPGALRLTIFQGESWRTTTVRGAAIDEVHPDLTGARVLLEHHDDRWTLVDLN